jgi:hypothetical protein
MAIHGPALYATWVRVDWKLHAGVTDRNCRKVDEVAAIEEIVQGVIRPLHVSPVDAIGDAIDAESELPFVDDGGHARVDREAAAAG